MRGRITSRLSIALALVGGPLFAVAACGGSGDDSIAEAQDDASAADVAIDRFEDSAFDVGARDASKVDAHVDAGAPDAAKTLNRCGGYIELALAGNPVTPGDSCGDCNDGTIACVGSNVVECAGGSNPPCPTPPVDAGPNACGGYGPITYQAADASVGDSCGGCGTLQCASTTALVCTGSSVCAFDAGSDTTCTIPSSAYTTPFASPTLPAETRPAVTSTSTIALPAVDLEYNPYDGFLYASILSYVTDGNSIAKIDPMSATVVGTLYVGSSPNHLSISDDGKALWVVVGGTGFIQRVDLTTFTRGAVVTPDPFYFPDRGDIQVLAGTEDSLAVTEYVPAYGDTTVIYDHGVPRPYAAVISDVQPYLRSPSASLVLAEDFDSLRELCVNGAGAFLSTGLALGRSFTLTAAFSDGVIYGSDGNEYDPQVGTILHTFPVAPADYTAVTVDAEDVYYLTTSFDNTSSAYLAQVTGFDRTTYAATTTELLSADHDSSQSFTRWGRYGFAYLDNMRSIQIARSTIIPDMP